MVTWSPLPVYQPRPIGVEGLFNFGNLLGGHPYKPLPQRLGPICEPCWLHSAILRPVGLRRCPHGGAA